MHIDREEALPLLLLLLDFVGTGASKSSLRQVEGIGHGGPDGTTGAGRRPRCESFAGKFAEHRSRNHVLGGRRMNRYKSKKLV
jgi:hypothetical protein